MITQTPSGQQIYYWTAGSGEPLILVHSATCDADFMRPLSDQLDDEFRCIALDRVGYQRSSQIDHDTTVDEQVEAIRAVHMACTDAPAWVFGHSSGGNFALAYAVRFPELVTGLVLMEPALYAMYPPDATPPAIATMLNEIIPTCRGGDLERGMGQFVQLLGIGSDTIQELSQLPFFAQSGTNAAAFANDQQVVIHGRPTDTELSGLRVPTLLLEGDRTGRLLRDVVALLRPRIPNATVTTLKDCDHMAPQIRPGVVAEAVRAFMAKHEPAANQRPSAGSRS